MLGVSGFSKYGPFTLKVKFSWNAGNVGNLRFIENDIFYLIFSKMCFVGLGTLVELI
jgi:hypothetical protein